MSTWNNIYVFQSELTVDSTAEFLLELNAWTIVLNEQSVLLKNFLMQSRGKLLLFFKYL